MPTILQGNIWFPKKGLDLESPKHLVSLDHASEGFDWYSDDGDIAAKKWGYADVNISAVSASPDITGLYSLYLSNGDKYELVSTSNGALWRDNSGTITTKVLSGLSTTLPVDYTQFLDTGIWADGSTTIKTWNGTASGTIAEASAVACETHLNKLFLALGNSSTFKYSATGSISTFTGAGTDTINFEQNNGQNIVTIKSFSRNELLIFKDRSMGKLVGYDKASFNLLTIDNAIGCAAKLSVKNFKANTGGGLMIWAAWDGIYAYDGSVPKKISRYIQPFWNLVNKEYLSNARATIDQDNGLYFLTIPYSTATTNSHTIVVNLNFPYQDEKGTHFPMFIWRDGWKALNTEITSANANKIVMGGANGIKNYYADSIFSNNGTSIAAYIVTPMFTFDGLGQDNALRRAYCVMESSSGNMSVYGEVKDGSDWVLQETFDMSGGADRLGIDFALGISPLGFPESNFSTRINMALRGRRIKIKFEQDSDSFRFKINSPVEFYFKQGGQRG